MAILRGGRRIGNFDIRLGFPRDKSLVDVAGDPRLKRKPGGNPKTTINTFIANLNEGEGIARSTRFLVRFSLPGKQFTSTRPDMIGPSANRNDLESQSIMQNVGMMCNKVTMPSRDINTKAHITHGPRRELPYAYSYSGQVEGTFIADKFLRQRAFFENWQNKVFDEDTHHINYYDNFVGQMDIYQLGSFSAEADRDRITYGVRLYEVYPELVGSINYSYGDQNQPIDIPITFRFRNWTNLTLNQVNAATIGKKYGDIPTIKAAKDYGLFSSILNKLPPVFKRAGRDVLQTVKRNLPIGRATGGRVFPPFL